MTDATQPRVALGTRLSACILAAVLFALLALAPFASASPDPVGSGKAKLYLKKGLVRKISNLNVKVLKWGSGSVKGTLITLDANGGAVDPLNGEGTVNTKSSEGFRFKHGKRAAPVSELEVNTRKNWVRAKVAGATMRLGFLSATTFVRNGFGVNLKMAKLKLTGKAAQRINNKLGLKNGLKGGRVLSNVYTTTQPETVAVLANGNKTTLVLSVSAVEKLLPLKVKLAPLPPAEEELALPPSLFFPISGGTIGPTAAAGTVEHAGGLTLEQNLEEFGAIGAGTTKLTLANLFLDLTTKVATAEITVENPKTAALNLGPLGRASIADIDLSGATIGSDVVAHTVTVNGASASLQAVTAETLNSLFAEPVLKEAGKGWFAAGDPLGTVSFTAQTQ